MEDHVEYKRQNVSQVEKNSASQPAVIMPEKPKINYLIAGIVLVFFLAGGFIGYYLGKKSVYNSEIIPSENVTGTVSPQGGLVSPTIEADFTSGWKVFAAPGWGFTFKYPPSITVGEKKSLSASPGTPQEYLQIGNLLVISRYYDRLKTEWFIQNMELIDKTQTDLRAVTIEGEEFALTKVNWEDGGGPAGGIPDCEVGTAQPEYFVDIPDKLSLSIIFQEIKSCDPVKGQIIQKGINGEIVSDSDFEEQLRETYQILESLRFTD